jgi:HAD hydrolase, TIGR01457 family
MYKAYFIDLDGTMYRGKDRIPTAEAFIKRLQEAQIPFLFVTNNATKTPAQVAENLRVNYGTEVSADEVYTSGVAAVDYLKSHFNVNRVMVIGEEAIKNQVEAAGYTLVSEEPEVVLQSLDRNVTYKDLETATLAIRSGATYIVTNIDSNLPSEKGPIPGSGAITGFLKVATQVEPIIIGKPSSVIMESALDYLNAKFPDRHFTKEDIAMVGDNYQTDIQAGIQYGMDTLMVLTGFSTREDLEKVEEQPTHLVEDLSEWTI